MRKLSSVAAAGMSAVLVLGLAAPAEANVRRFSDSRSDTASGIDIWSVRVDNSTKDRSKVRVRIRQDDVTFGDSITVYLDTRPADPGPEFAMYGATASEYSLHHTEWWKKAGKMVPGDCGYRERIKAGKDITRVMIPRRCINKPGKIRVAVRTTRNDPAATDWAAARRAFLGFVRR
jgi:hypothetical protein